MVFVAFYDFWGGGTGGAHGRATRGALALGTAIASVNARSSLSQLTASTTCDHSPSTF